MSKPVLACSLRFDVVRELVKNNIPVKVWFYGNAACRKELLPEAKQFCKENNIIAHHYEKYKAFNFQGFEESLEEGAMESIRQIKEKNFELFLRFFLREKNEHYAFQKAWGLSDYDAAMYKSIRCYYDMLTVNGIKTVIFANVPHSGSIVLLHKTAEFLNIDRYITTQSIFANKIWCSKNAKFYNFFDKKTLVTPKTSEPIAIPEVKEPHYMKKGKVSKGKRVIKMLDDSFKILFRTIIFYWLFYPEKYKIKFQRWLKNLQPLPKTFLEFDVDELTSEKFVYFPLHLQPEMTTDSLGGAYVDQLLALERLSELLPADIKIYCKENPKQKFFMRPIEFYERMKAIPKVKIVSPSMPSFPLSKKSVFVATITGTAGWEAIRMGKNVLVFGDAWYAECSGVYKFSEELNIEDLLTNKFTKESLKESFDSVTSALHVGVVDLHYSKIVKDFDKDKNAKQVAQSLISIMTT